MYLPRISQDDKSAGGEAPFNTYAIFQRICGNFVGSFAHEFSQVVRQSNKVA